MSSFVDADAVCPFYLTSSGSIISCKIEPSDDVASVRIYFKAKDNTEEWLTDFCCDKECYQNCTYYRAHLAVLDLPPDNN